MSHVQKLEALLRQKEQERQHIMSQLNRARSSQSSATAAALDFESVPGNYQIAPSRPVLANTGRSRSNTIPRSVTAATGIVADHAAPLQLDHVQSQDHSRPMKRSKTTHNAGPSAAAGMARSSSNMSIQQGVRSSSLSGPVMIEQYLGQGQIQQPANVFFHTHTQLQPIPTGREMDVADFLSMRDTADLSTSSPIAIPSSRMLSPQEASHYPESSIPSACGSLTSGPSLGTAPMSRCNSNMNDNAAVVSQFEMIRIQSQHSTQGHGRQEGFGPAHLPYHQPTLLGKRSATDLQMGTGPSISLAGAYASSAPTDSMLHQHQMKKSLSQSSSGSTSSAAIQELNAGYMNDDLSMERSVSRDSMKSNPSLKFRAKEALARQNVNAKSRQLQPKPEVTKKEAATPASSKKDAKAVITKTKYERPKHPKVKCHQCNENPEGFRGEHELRRHTEAKHKSMVKKWICQDPGLLGIPHAETAAKPLSDCKQCSAFKQYGAYYNAAAHLRRTHFKVKARKGAGSKNGPKGANSAPKTEEEKRGGKGGGDWPPMSELKLWMVEVTVPMDQEGALGPDGTDSVGAVEQEDIDNELGAQAYGMAPNLVGMDAYSNMAVYAGLGGSFSQDASPHGLPSELGSQLSDLYPLDTSAFPASFHGLPISSASFADYAASQGHHLQQGMPPSSMMSIDTSSYTSPVSSTATLTQAAMFADHMLPPAMMHNRDDLHDMTFDLAFPVGGH
ncbi:hypothetical protein QBC40DRAFT_108970 [Triangularia verruculosa]|uniref:DUF7896 domain-containing protein n=1 Tax=Triangularia verruculosa TaxID=2587418 RepID=A0AAN6XA86_9PEZI|nr:hypothetical protein QBC40DRAFT_108970 [Triangularia verruculosa]